MKSLHKKLFRDIKSVRAQAITIGLVIAAGISYMVGSFAAYQSLIQAQEQFYKVGNLADGFVYLNRAPDSILRVVSSLPLISIAETRISQEVSLDFPDENLPSSGLLMNLPISINKLSLRSGRYPRGNNEVIINEAFALENNLKIGGKLVAIIKGQRSILTVTGTALSPEFVYIFRPSSPLPDDKHYGILWMDRKSVESSLGMDSAFNQILFKFSGLNDNKKKATLQKIDEILKPYGGLGAQDRSKIPSHSLLEDEFKQLRSTAVFLPGIFLAVAAFLLHIITSRIVSKEREQIATLKAIGYNNSRILLHYLELVSIITLISSILGTMGGYYLGKILTNLYGTYYKFPNLNPSYEPILALFSMLIGFLSGAFGAFNSLKKVVKLEPATAMRPPAPDAFSFTSWEKWFPISNSQSRMIMRNFLRRPARTMLTILGLSSAVMIMIVGGFFKDTIALMLEIQFERIQRESISISLFNALDDSVIYEFLEKDGVLLAEGVRNVPIRIHSANQKKESVIIGMSKTTVLRRILDQEYNPIEIPDSGILINYDYAMRLNIKPGDLVRIEILEGARAEKTIRVAGLVREVLGQGIYMDRKALNRLLLESNAINQIYLKIDPSFKESLINDLKRSPKIAGFMNKEIFLKTFKDLMERTMESTSFFIFFFTAIISIGVVYNTAMIALSERNYELGSLRILGFHLNEVFFILIAELSMQVFLAIPIGCFFGLKMAGLVINMNDTEVFRFPAIIGVRTYLSAIATIIFTSILSFVIIYFKLKKMDLLSVLKVRE